jgi:hypothetical protein
VPERPPLELLAIIDDGALIKLALAGQTETVWDWPGLNLPSPATFRRTPWRSSTSTLQDPEAKAKLAVLTALYEDKPRFFVDRLAQGTPPSRPLFIPNR